MGQGVYTAISIILAEEAFDADFSKVAFEHAPASDKLYGNPLFGVQVTGNSNSIRAFWEPLRRAGAAARAMLVQAAAQRWRITEPVSCSASNSKVFHASSGQTLAYGELIDAAVLLPVPQDPPLKNPKDFVLIGKPVKRLDTPDRTDGQVIYGINAMLPGMQFATLAACPVFGGKVSHVDDRGAKAVLGVRQVVVLDDLVAVVGDHMWAAKMGLSTLDIKWDEGPNAGVSSQGIWEDLRAASGKEGAVAKSRGDIAKGLSRERGLRGRIRTAVLGACYDGAFELHCSGLLPGECEIWTGTQVMTRVQAAAAKAAGVCQSIK